MYKKWISPIKNVKIHNFMRGGVFAGRTEAMLGSLELHKRYTVEDILIMFPKDISQDIMKWIKIKYINMNEKCGYKIPDSDMRTIIGDIVSLYPFIIIYMLNYYPIEDFRWSDHEEKGKMWINNIEIIRPTNKINVIPKRYPKKIPENIKYKLYMKNNINKYKSMMDKIKERRNIDKFKNKRLTKDLRIFLYNIHIYPDKLYMSGVESSDYDLTYDEKNTNDNINKSLNYKWKGYIKTIACSIDVQQIRDNGGEVIVHGGYVWDNISNEVFTPYINPLRKAKQKQSYYRDNGIKKKNGEDKYNPSMYTMLKGAMNGLTGSVGMSIFDTIFGMLYSWEDCKKIKESKNYKINRFEGVDFYTMQKKNPEGKSPVYLYVFLLAYARKHMYNMLMYVAYSDTDSGITWIFIFKYMLHKFKQWFSD